MKSPQPISLVTGAGKKNAIGFQIALKLLEEGGIVNVVDIVEGTEIQAAFKEAAEKNSSIKLENLRVHQADITDREQVKNVVQGIRQECKDKDALFTRSINCAGLAKFDGVNLPKDITLMHRVNVEGALNVVEESAILMQEQVDPDKVDGSRKPMIVNFGTATKFINDTAREEMDGLKKIASYIDGKKKAAEGIEGIAQQYSAIEFGEYCPGHVQDTSMFAALNDFMIETYGPEADIDNVDNNEVLRTALEGSGVNPLMTVEEVRERLFELLDNGFPEQDGDKALRIVLHDKQLSAGINTVHPAPA